MITRESLRASIGQYMRSAFLIGAPVTFLSAWLAMKLGAKLAGPLWNRHMGNFESAADWYTLGAALLSCLVVCAPLVALVLYLGRTVCVECPECGTPFYPKLAYRVLATGSCPRCGTEIFPNGPNNRSRGP